MLNFTRAFIVVFAILAILGVTAGIVTHTSHNVFIGLGSAIVSYLLYRDDKNARHK